MPLVITRQSKIMMATKDQASLLHTSQLVSTWSCREPNHKAYIMSAS
uniref:Uncharacterized protein n=1 Tax=Aegilops tauschii subsp. strangulata TaxID=200361 RepID=A0A453A4P1_AEGTS